MSSLIPAEIREKYNILNSKRKNYYLLILFFSKSNHLKLNLIFFKIQIKQYKLSPNNMNSYPIH